MANRIDSFVDAFSGWLSEYEQKQGVALSGAGDSAVPAEFCALREAKMESQEANSLSPDGAAGIHLVDREISLGTHPQGCQCLECGIEQKFEEE